MGGIGGFFFTLLAKLFPFVTYIIGLWLWNKIIYIFYVPVYTTPKNHRDPVFGAFVCKVVKYLGYFAITLYMLIGF